MTGHLPLNSEWHSCTFREELDTGVTSTGRHQKVGGYSRSDGCHGLEGENITVSIKSVIISMRRQELDRGEHEHGASPPSGVFLILFLPCLKAFIVEVFHLLGGVA